LSSETETKFHIDSLSQQKDLSFSLTRAKYEEICTPIFNRLLPPLEEALKNSKLSKKDIHEIIMVGGSTRIPKVRQIVQNFFEGKTLNFEINPDEAVAAGAAIQAAKLNGD
jgi:heat shock 70kDa protein 1/2/6/8